MIRGFQNAMGHIVGKMASQHVLGYLSGIPVIQSWKHAKVHDCSLLTVVFMLLLPTKVVVLHILIFLHTGAIKKCLNQLITE